MRNGISGARPPASCGSCTSGSVSHDPAGAYRDRDFPDSFRSLCAVLDGNPFRTAGPVLMAGPSGGKTRARIIASGHHQLSPARAFLRRFAELHLRPRAYRERQARSRSREMNSSRVLNAPWLSSGPALRVLQLLNDKGEEARVVGGAVRN